MSAQSQCDQPHVLFELQRTHPANWDEDLAEIENYAASCSNSPRQSLMFMSDSYPTNFKQELQALGSPFTLDAPLPHVLPQPISLPSIPEDYPIPSTSTLPSTTHISSSIMFNTLIDQPPNSMLLQTYDDRITSLERSVCSNFVCCGIHLADFHALIDHFEENHVSVITVTGKRLYPPQGFRAQQLRPHQETSSSSNARSPRRPGPPKIITSFPSPSPSSATIDSTTSTPASSRSSSVVSSPPMPTTPLAPSQSFDSAAIVSHDRAPPPVLEYNPYLGLSIALPQPQYDPELLSPYSVDVISAFGPEYDFSRDYACYENAFAEKRRREEEALQEEDERQRRLEFIQECLDREQLSESFEVVEDELSSPPPFSSSTQSPSLSYNESASSAKKATKWREASVVDEPPVSSQGGRVFKAKPKVPVPSPIAQSTATGRKREKAYKCPHHGCTKAYLNPNGLKYHLEKGTCKFEDPMPESSSTSSSSSSSSSPSSNSANKSESPSPVSVEASTPSASTSFTYQYSKTPLQSTSSTSPSNPTNPATSYQYTAPHTSPIQNCETYSPTQSDQIFGVLNSEHLSYSDPSEECCMPSIPPSSQSRSSPATSEELVPDASQPTLTQSKLGQGSRFAAVYSHHLHIHPMNRAQVICDGGAPSSSSL